MWQWSGSTHTRTSLARRCVPGLSCHGGNGLHGFGDKQIVSELPARIDPSKILFIGLRDWECDEIKERQKGYGIKHLTSEDVRENSDAIREWLKSCGASKVVVHFDMDVLDPAEIIAAVGVVPNGMKIAEVVRVINDIAQEKEIVDLPPLPNRCPVPLSVSRKC